MKIAVIALFLVCIIGTIECASESKVVFDAFTAADQWNPHWPTDTDCNEIRTTTDDSIFGTTRNLRFGDIIALGYACPGYVDCQLSSTIGNGQWLVEMTQQYEGDCHITAMYPGKYDSYGFNGAEGFRLSTNGADSIRVVATVTGGPVRLYVAFYEGFEYFAFPTLEAGDHELILPFEENWVDFYYDVIFDITLTVEFQDIGSIAITAFETYGPSSEDSPYPLPTPVSVDSVTIVETIDDFSGSLQAQNVSSSSNSFCPDVSVDTTVGSYDKTVSLYVYPCPAEAGTISFSEGNGVLSASSTTGLAVFVWATYEMNQVDFCSTDSIVVDYSVDETALCSVSMTSDEEDYYCWTHFLLYPDATRRVLLFSDFQDDNTCNRSSIINTSIQCHVTNPVKFTLDGLSVGCTTSSCKDNCLLDQSSASDSKSSKSSKTSNSSASSSASVLSIGVLAILWCFLM